jgi:putative hemolysin
VSLAQPVEDRLGVLGRAAEPASIVVVTLVLSYLTLVFGELAPKRVAMQRAERWALVAARPLAAMATLTRPVVAGNKPHNIRNVVDSPAPLASSNPNTSPRFT